MPPLYQPYAIIPETVYGIGTDEEFAPRTTRWRGLAWSPVREAPMTPQHVVEELYQGEVLGEALFNRMLRDAADDDRQRHVVASLLQLETETKALLRQAVAARRLRLEEDEAQRASGETIAASLGDLTWLDKMERLRAGIADHFLPRYQRIAAEAEADDRAVTALMVRHEAALLEVVTREAAGQGESSLAPLAEHLHYPLPPPPDTAQ